MHSLTSLLRAGPLGRGYEEEPKGQKWPGLTLPLGLPDGEYSSCLLLTPSPQEAPLAL